MNKKAISPVAMVLIFVALIISFSFFMLVLNGVQETQVENSSFYNATNSTTQVASSIMPKIFLAGAFVVFFVLILWAISYITKH